MSDLRESTRSVHFNNEPFQISEGKITSAFHIFPEALNRRQYFPAYSVNTSLVNKPGQNFRKGDYKIISTMKQIKKSLIKIPASQS